MHPTRKFENELKKIGIPRGYEPLAKSIQNQAFPEYNTSLKLLSELVSNSQKYSKAGIIPTFLGYTQGESPCYALRFNIINKKYAKLREPSLPSAFVSSHLRLHYQGYPHKLQLIFDPVSNSNTKGLTANVLGCLNLTHV